MSGPDSSPIATRPDSVELRTASLLVAVLATLTLAFAAVAHDLGPTATIAAALTGVLLTLAMVRGAAASSPLLAGIIVATAIAQVVPGWTYLSAEQDSMIELAMISVLAVAGVVLLLPGLPGAAPVWWGVAAAFAALAAAAIALSVPDIDVVDFVNDGARHVFTDDIYDRTWISSGIDDGAVHPGFPYFPATAVALWPFALLGDARYGLLVLLLISAWVISRQPHHGPQLGILLLCFPGTLLMLQSSWTEPLVAALLLPAVVLLSRTGRAGWVGVALFAAALASKQHVLLLVPLLLAWSAVDRSRRLAVVVGAGILVAPWLVMDGPAFVRATIEDQLDSPKRPDSISLWTVLDRMDVAPPYALMTVLVVATAVALAVWVGRSPADTERFAYACALMLLVANLVNKQGFYNQYWLVGALILLGLASHRSSGAPDVVRAEARQERVPAPEACPLGDRSEDPGSHQEAQRAAR